MAFAQVMDKLVEHYGIVLGESTIRRTTEGHAKNIFEAAKIRQDWPTQPGSSAVIIAEMDGGMVPIVVSNPKLNDNKLSLVKFPFYAARPRVSKVLSSSFLRFM